MMITQRDLEAMFAGRASAALQREIEEEFVKLLKLQAAAEDLAKDYEANGGFHTGAAVAAAIRAIIIRTLTR